MVAARRSFHGVLPVASMPRLVAALAGDRGEVEYDLEFGDDQFGTHCLGVRAKAVVVLECQRTLQPFELPVEVDVRLGLIKDERDEAGLPPGFEPLLLDSGAVNPVRVIEDELLLALPPFPVKPGVEAEMKTWDGSGWISAARDDAEATEVEKENPFAVLREWGKHNQ